MTSKSFIEADFLIRTGQTPQRNAAQDKQHNITFIRRIIKEKNLTVCENHLHRLK